MSDEEIVLLPLRFTESACGDCGSEGAVGKCPDCGGTRPDNTDTDPILRMRRQALAGMAERVDALSLELAPSMEGHIPCTALQYGFVLADSGVFDEWEAVVTAYKQLHNLDLGDQSVVGKTLRRRVMELVDRATSVASLQPALTWFAPPPSGIELQAMIWALIRSAVDLAATTIRVLTAGQEEAVGLMPEMQNCLEPMDFERFGELLDLLRREPDSLDDRVGAALGITGAATNGYGALDFARVFAACAGEEDPLLDVSRRVTRFLRHAMHDPEAVGAVASILALPAASLASVDRPLIGHRVAHELAELLWRAHEKDEQLTRSLVGRTLDDGPRLLAAMARAETTQRRMALDVDATPGDAISDLVELYASAAESGFRSYPWLALGLQRLVDGEAVRLGEPMPMLGEIAQQLAASSRVLARLLSEAVSPSLRNAAKHESYSAGADGSSVDLRGETLEEEELAQLTQRMTACVAGMDGAIAAWGLESGLLLEALPPADASAGSVYARRVILRSLVTASGGELVSSQWGATVTLVVSISRPLVRANLLRLLAAASPLWPEAACLEMRDESGILIVAASADSFARFAKADAAELPIATLYGVFDAAVAAGEDQTEAAQDALAVMIRLLSPEAMEESESVSKKATLRTLSARITAMRAFVASHGLGSRQHDDVSSRLRRAEIAAREAVRGDQGAVARVWKALMPLVEWSTRRDANFGGLFLPW